MTKKYLFPAAATAVLFAWAGLALGRAAQDHTHKNAFTPDTIHWGPAPPVVQKEAQFAVLEGDPTASSGDYTIRLKMPDGFRIAPHWHCTSASHPCNRSESSTHLARYVAQ